MTKMISEEEFKNLKEEDKYLLYKGVYIQVENAKKEISEDLTKDLDNHSPEYTFAMGYAIGSLSKYLGGYTKNTN